MSHKTSRRTAKRAHEDDPGDALPQTQAREPSVPTPATPKKGVRSVREGVAAPSSPGTPGTPKLHRGEEGLADEVKKLRMQLKRMATEVQAEREAREAREVRQALEQADREAREAREARDARDQGDRGARDDHKARGARSAHAVHEVTDGDEQLDDGVDDIGSLSCFLAGAAGVPADDGDGDDGVRLGVLRSVAKAMGTNLVRFSGEDVSSLRPFLDDVETIGVSQGLRGRELILLACIFLTGAARVWARSEQAARTTSWRKFRDAICTRFSIQTDLQSAAGTIASLNERRNDAVMVTLNRFQVAMDLCDSLGQRIPSELQVALLCASLPKTLADDVRAHNFSSLQTACQYAAQRATPARATDGDRRGRGQRDADSGRFTKRFHGGARVTRPQGRAQGGESSGGTKGKQGDGTPQTKGGSERRCFTCNMVGHVARDCPEASRKN